jgi:hypothetical protein
MQVWPGAWPMWRKQDRKVARFRVRCGRDEVRPRSKAAGRVIDHLRHRLPVCFPSGTFQRESLHREMRPRPGP